MKTVEGEDLTAGLETEADERITGHGQGGAKAADVVRSILADLDRRWSIPPVALCHELALQTVQALTREPHLLDPLVETLVERLAVRLAQELTLLDPDLVSEIRSQNREFLAAQVG